MSSISPIGPYGGSFYTPQVLNGTASPLSGLGGAGQMGASSMIGSASSMSMTSVNETIIAGSMGGSNSGAAVSNEMLGMVLLMMMMEYMQSSDPEQKQGLLDTMTALIDLQSQQSQQSQSSQFFMRSTSVVTMESSQMMFAQQGMGAYQPDPGPQGPSMIQGGGFDAIA